MSGLTPEQALADIAAKNTLLQKEILEFRQAAWYLDNIPWGATDEYECWQRLRRCIKNAEKYLKKTGENT